MKTSPIEALRAYMRQRKVDAVIIPQTDPHHGEYLADHWQVRRHLSGFTGSAGILVVTESQALLWTDSRYFLQAANQLAGSDIQLMKDGLPDTPSIEAWLASHLHEGQTVGLDGMLYSIAEAGQLRKSLDAHGINLVTNFDPVAPEGGVWPDRPALPLDPIYIHDVKYAGEEASSKIARLLRDVNDRGADALIISALDEIAWVLNIRSNDVTDNPVATAHLYLGNEERLLFFDLRKSTPDLDAYLESLGIEKRDYTAFVGSLATLPGQRILLSAAQCGVRLLEELGSRAVVGESLVALMKAQKNPVQMQGVRAAMLRDGVAMVRSLKEITDLFASGTPFTEINVAEILTKYRSQGDMYMSESFATIAGFGPHGAIVHYSATPETSTTITERGLLLIDSGAQYLDGTTDITRTIALGQPTAEERHDFTLVMKGHIAIATAVFPEGTRGHQLDAMARMPLWKEGKSYLHGTGHGVGHFLGVHEGPQSIRLNDTMAPLMPGMITSNEPGIYLEGRYGVRCENLVETVEAVTTEFGRFYRFETLTLCPWDRALFDTSIMSEEETKWVDDYHARVRRELMPLIDDEPTRHWLEEATKPLGE